MFRSFEDTFIYEVMRHGIMGAIHERFDQQNNRAMTNRGYIVNDKNDNRLTLKYMKVVILQRGL